MSFETSQSAEAPAEAVSEEINVNAVETPEGASEESAQEVPPEPKIETKIDERLSGKFAALSRKEKMLKQRESQFQVQMQQQMRQMEELKAQLEKQASEYEGYKKSIKTNPLKKLQEEGFSFDDLTNMQLNEQNPTPDMQIKMLKEELESKYSAELQKLREELTAKENLAKENAEKNVVNQFKTNINNHIEAQADKYELINLNGAQELVYEVAEEYYNDTGKLLSVEEAADYTERYLEEEANKLLKAKKLQQKQQMPKSEMAPKSQQSMTLSNNLSAEAPKAGMKQMSREESLEQAAKMLRWET